jgi:hypothetical protein
MHHLRLLYRLLLLLSMVQLVGCGSSTYNEQFDARQEELDRRSKETKSYAKLLRELFGASVLKEGTKVKMKMPALAKSHRKRRFEIYQADNDHDDDEGIISPQRLQPPFLELPGFQTCWEAWDFLPTDESDDEVGEEVPFYCYIAVLPAKPPAAEDAEEVIADEETDEAEGEGQSEFNSLAIQLHEVLQEKFPDVSDEWEKVSCPTPDDRTNKWLRLSVPSDEENPQHFFCLDTDGNRVERQLPARFDLYLYKGNKFHVIVAWRVPDVINESAFSINDLVPVCLGTLTGADE